MLDWLRFERACLAKAFSGKFWPIEKWSGGLAVILLFVTKVLPLPEGVVEVMENIPLYFVIFVFCITAFAGYFIAPYQLYKEQLEERLSLEAKRQPRLSISIDSEDGRIFQNGSTSETVGGDRQTIGRTVTPTLLTVVCRNIGETRAKNCVARLISFTGPGELTGFEQDIFEPIELAWSPITAEEKLVQDIEPNGARRILVAYVRRGGQVWLTRDPNDLPIEYQRIFGNAGDYEAILQVDCDNLPPIQTKLLISGIAQEESDKILIPGDYLEFGKGRISILAQGSPTLS